MKTRGSGATTVVDIIILLVIFSIGLKYFHTHLRRYLSASDKPMFNWRGFFPSADGDEDDTSFVCRCPTMLKAFSINFISRLTGLIAWPGYDDFADVPTRKAVGWLWWWRDASDANWKLQQNMEKQKKNMHKKKKKYKQCRLLNFITYSCRSPTVYQIDANLYVGMCLFTIKQWACAHVRVEKGQEHENRPWPQG